jgi:N-acetylglucosaminyldiphosphoundecaprenol N-acetyl-beta-D-mannosaminyltransferase
LTTVATTPRAGAGTHARTAGHGTAPGRISILGLEIDAVTEAQAIATVLHGLTDGRGGFVVTPNLEQLRQLAARPELAGLFGQADLVVADGMPLVWASRIQGSPLAERVAGSDIVWSLTAEASLRDRSIFLLGGAPGVAEAAEGVLRRRYPGARLAGHHCPPMGFERDRTEIDAIRRALQEADADIVYVGLGFPKQERLITYLLSEFPRTWFLGVGYSLSFIAGQSSRAPVWMSRLGLEWLHRLAKEPRRLAKRYLWHGLPFAARLLASAAWARLRGRDCHVPTRSLAHRAWEQGDSRRIVFPKGSAERERNTLLDELMADE